MGNPAFKLALAAAATEHLDAHGFFGSGVVCDVDLGLLLNHVKLTSSSKTNSAQCGR